MKKLLILLLVVGCRPKINILVDPCLVSVYEELEDEIPYRVKAEVDRIKCENMFFIAGRYTPEDGTIHIDSASVHQEDKTEAMIILAHEFGHVAGKGHDYFSPIMCPTIEMAKKLYYDERKFMMDLKDLFK